MCFCKKFIENHEKGSEIVLNSREGFKKHDCGAEMVPKECKIDQNGSHSNPKSIKLTQNGIQKPPTCTKKEPYGKVSIFDAKNLPAPLSFDSNLGAIF